MDLLLVTAVMSRNLRYQVCVSRDVFFLVLRGLSNVICICSGGGSSCTRNLALISSPHNALCRFRVSVCTAYALTSSLSLSFILFYFSLFFSSPHVRSAAYVRLLRPVKIYLLSSLAYGAAKRSLPSTCERSHYIPRISVFICNSPRRYCTP